MGAPLQLLAAAGIAFCGLQELDVATYVELPDGGKVTMFHGFAGCGHRGRPDANLHWGTLDEDGVAEGAPTALVCWERRGDRLVFYISRKDGDEVREAPVSEEKVWPLREEEQCLA